MRFHLLLPIAFISFLALTGCSRDPTQTPTPDLISRVPGSAVIDGLDVQQLAGDVPTYQAVVRGHLTDTCTRITGADAARDESGFTIEIRTALLGEVNCLEGTIDFERVVPIEVSGLGPGQYSLRAGPFRGRIDLAAAASTAALETPPPQATEGATIQGAVWHDECINQTEGNPDHAGCIRAGEGFVADGARGEGETGIEGVRVDLGEGGCPSTGLDRTSSGPDGRFQFTGLRSGTYCVSINQAIPENAISLSDGVWTAPEAGAGSLTVELADAEGGAEIALGWDFSTLPEFTSAEGPEPDCVARAAYYGDVTIPDNTVMEPGETFVKTWRVRNEGTCTWGPGYELVLGNGDLMGGSPTPLPHAEPGDIVEASVELIAPEESGYYRGNWGFRDPHGQAFAVGTTGTTPVWVQIVVSFYSGAAPAGASGSLTCGETLNGDYITQLLDLINLERGRRQLPPLQMQEQLGVAAQAHSSDMACNDFLAHTGTGDTTYRDRVRAHGYTDFNYLTENIYAGADLGGTPEVAMEWWMNSQVHRDAILHPTVSDIGIGYAFTSTSDYGSYYTLLFAQPIE